MNHFDYRNGVLHAEAVSLSDLAASVGTPFYCYSTATLERHYRVFAEASKQGIALHELSLQAMQAVEPRITKDALAVLSVESSVKSRTSYGGTAPKNVQAQAKAWLKRLEKERKLG